MDLFYRESGSGEPVIMIHGLMGMSDNWIPVARGLAGNYRMVMPDLRNHGKSTHHKEFNLTVLTEDIFALCQKLKINSAVFIGHSLGGRIAMAVALQKPQMVSRLVVEDIAPRRYFGNKSIARLLSIMSGLDLKGMRSINEINEVLKSVLPDNKNSQLVLKNIRKKAGGGFEWKLNLEVLADNLEALMTPVYGEATFTGPTLFFKGALSNLLTEEDHKIIHKHFPSASIQLIPDAGHWVHTDQPKLFLEKLALFLKQS